MKWNWKQHVVAVLIYLAIGISFAAVYSDLPDRLPVHFGLQGTPDSYAGKGTYAAFILALPAVVGLMLTFIPMIDPFWKGIQPKYGLFLLMRDLLLGLFLFLHLLCLEAAWTGVLNVRLFGVGFGLFFVVLGNYLPKVPRNWFVGIRVPWTLASEEVWKRTHRLGGWLFVLGGCVMMLLSVSGFSLVVSLLLPLLPIFLIAGLVYPYLLFRKLQKTEG